MDNSIGIGLTGRRGRAAGGVSAPSANQITAQQRAAGTSRVFLDASYTVPAGHAAFVSATTNGTVFGATTLAITPGGFADLTAVWQPETTLFFAVVIKTSPGGVVVAASNPALVTLTLQAQAPAAALEWDQAEAAASDVPGTQLTTALTVAGGWPALVEADFGPVSYFVNGTAWDGVTPLAVGDSVYAQRTASHATGDVTLTTFALTVPEPEVSPLRLIERTDAQRSTVTNVGGSHTKKWASAHPFPETGRYIICLVAASSFAEGTTTTMRIVGPPEIPITRIRALRDSTTGRIFYFGEVNIDTPGDYVLEAHTGATSYAWSALVVFVFKADELGSDYLFNATTASSGATPVSSTLTAVQAGSAVISLACNTGATVYQDFVFSGDNIDGAESAALLVGNAGTGGVAYGVTSVVSDVTRSTARTSGTAESMTSLAIPPEVDATPAVVSPQAPAIAITTNLLSGSPATNPGATLSQPVAGTWRSTVAGTTQGAEPVLYWTVSGLTHRVWHKLSVTINTAGMPAGALVYAFFAQSLEAGARVKDPGLIQSEWGIGHQGIVVDPAVPVRTIDVFARPESAGTYYVVVGAFRADSSGTSDRQIALGTVLGVANTPVVSTHTALPAGAYLDVTAISFGAKPSTPAGTVSDLEWGPFRVSFGLPVIVGYYECGEPWVAPSAGQPIYVTSAWPHRYYDTDPASTQYQSGIMRDAGRVIGSAVGQGFFQIAAGGNMKGYQTAVNVHPNVTGETIAIAPSGNTSLTLHAPSLPLIGSFQNRAGRFGILTALPAPLADVGAFRPATGVLNKVSPGLLAELPADMNAIFPSLPIPAGWAFNAADLAAQLVMCEPSPLEATNATQNLRASHERDSYSSSACPSWILAGLALCTAITHAEKLTIIRAMIPNGVNYAAGASRGVLSFPAGGNTATEWFQAWATNMVASGRLASATYDGKTINQLLQEETSDISLLGVDVIPAMAGRVQETGASNGKRKGSFSLDMHVGGQVQVPVGDENSAHPSYFTSYFDNGTARISAAAAILYMSNGWSKINATSQVAITGVLAWESRGWDDPALSPVPPYFRNYASGYAWQGFEDQLIPMWEAWLASQARPFASQTQGWQIVDDYHLPWDVVQGRAVSLDLVALEYSLAAAPTNLQVISGALPAGLTFSGLSIVGTPTAAPGLYPVTVRASTAGGAQIGPDSKLLIYVQPAAPTSGLVLNSTATPELLNYSGTSYGICAGVPLNGPGRGLPCTYTSLGSGAHRIRRLLTFNPTGAQQGRGPGLAWRLMGLTPGATYRVQANATWDAASTYRLQAVASKTPVNRTVIAASPQAVAGAALVADFTFIAPRAMAWVGVASDQLDDSPQLNTPNTDVPFTINSLSVEAV